MRRDTDEEKIEILKEKVFLLIFSLCSFSAFGVTGSITDPGFSSEQRLKESLFGPLRGSLKTRFSRNLRRSDWRYFFSPSKRDNFFDTLFIKTDLSLDYPLAESFPALKESSSFNEILLFFILSYRRPLYDTFQVIRRHCFQLYFCFGETNLGISHSFSWRGLLKNQYSVYLNIPITSKRSIDRKKFMGIGASLRVSYPLIGLKNFNISGMSSHFFETAFYGSRYSDEQGSESNEMFSVFNQLGLRFSPLKKSFIPAVLVYLDYLFSLDYHRDWFQGMSLGFSAAWFVGERMQVVAGLSWGGAIFRHEYTSKAREARPFNPDETFINGGFIYSF